MPDALATLIRTLGACLCAPLLLAACGEPTATAWSGYAEGDYVYVAAPLAGRLDVLAVQAASSKGQGAALFTLESDVERAAQAEARARLASAQAQAANTTKGRRDDEIAVALAQLQQAQSAVALAQADLARQHQLVAQAPAALRVARLPARVDERAAAAAGADAADQVLEQARWRLRQKQQTAPQAGVVAEVYFRTGEQVQAGQPVLALLPPQNRKARFFVPQDQIASVAPGQTVQLTCDGCGAPLTAHISRIATQAEYTPPVIYSNAQRAKLVFWVEARVDGADALRLRPGQPLDVRP